MTANTFGLVGSGWRAEFFLRIAAALPEQFRVTGIVVRDATKGRVWETRWNLPTYRTLDDLLRATIPAFIVLSVPRAVAPSLLHELAARQVPVLTETPPALDLAGLRAVWQLVERGAHIEVAEQYLFQPLHAARLAIAQSGVLGTLSQAQVSVTNDYHGISLLRHFLGIGFDNATIVARTFVSPIIAGPTRQELPPEERIATPTQVIAQLDFGSRLGIYDFANDQHRSWIRSSRLLVRGDRGEIKDTQTRYLHAFDQPITLELRRENAGENGTLEGYYLKGILAGADWVYRNAFAPARLNDDEIAVATCLAKMAASVAKARNPHGYPFAQAAQDHYLSLMMQEAIATRQPVTTVTQPWAS